MHPSLHNLETLQTPRDWTAGPSLMDPDFGRVTSATVLGFPSGVTRLFSGYNERPTSIRGVRLQVNKPYSAGNMNEVRLTFRKNPKCLHGTGATLLGSSSPWRAARLHEAGCACQTG
jgi:hypothetical protein